MEGNATTYAFAVSEVAGWAWTRRRDCCSIWSSPRLILGKSGLGIWEVSFLEEVTSDDKSMAAGGGGG